MGHANGQRARLVPDRPLRHADRAWRADLRQPSPAPVRAGGVLRRLHQNRDLESRLEQADRLRRQQVERARYEADAARRRYLRVDPDNRLVADALEADWNEKLRALDAAQQEYERRRDADKLTLDETQRKRIAALASDFPSLWQATSTCDRDKKRMLRLLVEDVTLLKGREEITVHVRLRGGATRSVEVPRPQPAWKGWLAPAQTVAEIDRLLEQHTDGEVAHLLNERGVRSGKGGRFHSKTVANIRRRYALQSRYDRLRARGMVDAAELARLVGVSRQTILRWHRDGAVQAHAYNDKHQCLYEPAAPVPPPPARWASARASANGR
jgi:DNA-binding XRE family transcriptional regulator